VRSLQRREWTRAADQRILKTLGIQCSMIRAACCNDNAVLEWFIWSRKHERTNHEAFADLESARLSVFNYIEAFYNPVRLHQTLDYQAPDQYEAEFAPATAA
jgi:putative transposase